MSLAVLGLGLASFSGQAVTLAWDPSPDPDIVAYVLYWGYGSGTYSFSTNVGLQTNAVVTDLRPGVTYYFVVTAMNLPGLESDPSNEISYLVPGTNTPPTVSTISTQSTSEDTPTAALPFTVGDHETPAANLTVTARSSDPTLVPDANIVVSGSSANRSLRLTPAANRYGGPCLITLTVTDGAGGEAVTSFSLSVLAVNDPPTISPIPAQTVVVDTAPLAVPLTVGDVETPADDLSLRFASSEPGLISPTTISVTGSGAQRTLRITPASGRTGTAYLTVTVQDDDAGTASAGFEVTVVAAPGGTNALVAYWAFDEPSGDLVIDTVGQNTGLLVNGPARQPGLLGGGLRFDGLSSLVTVPDSSRLNFTNFSLSLWFKPSAEINATSGRKDLLKKSLSYWLIFNYLTADGRLAFLLNNGLPMVRSATASWDTNRWYHVVARCDASNLSLFINGNLEATAPATVPPSSNVNPLQIGGNPEQGFYFPGGVDDLRVYGNALNAADVQGLFRGGSPVNTTPVISAIGDSAVALGNTPPPIPFTIYDAETAADSLTLTGQSSNPALLPDANIAFGGAGSVRSLRCSPLGGTTGETMVSVRVSDGSSTSTRTFRFTVFSNSPPNVLELTINGQGTVTPNLAGRPLVIGRSYIMTARPNAGYLFAGWSGSTNCRVASLRFLMQSNLSLVATFVTNVFIAADGTYQGLFYEADEIRHDSSGLFKLTLTTNGLYSARVRYGNRSHAWAGRFAPDCRTTNIIRRLGASDLSIVLSLDTTSDQITGSVGDGTWTADLVADQAPIYTAARPCPQRGRYTFLLPATGGTNNHQPSTVATINPAGPAGDGYAAAYIGPYGFLSMVAYLADGRSFSQLAPVSRAGHWPLYGQLYLGRGSMLGWLNFADRVEDDLHGRVNWIRPSIAGAVYYPDGFTNEIELVGSRYVAPTQATNAVLAFTNGVVAFDGGDLLPGFTNQVTLHPKATVVNHSSNALTFTLGASAGLFVGSARHPTTRKTIAFKGAVLQKANYGAGFFLGTNQAGRVYFGE